MSANIKHSDISSTLITSNFTTGVNFCVGIVAHYPFHAVQASMRSLPMGTIMLKVPFFLSLFLVKAALISSSWTSLSRLWTKTMVWRFDLINADFPAHLRYFFRILSSLVIFLLFYWEDCGVFSLQDQFRVMSNKQFANCIGFMWQTDTLSVIFYIFVIQPVRLATLKIHDF